MTTTNVVPINQANTGNSDAQLADVSAVTVPAIKSNADLKAEAAATILEWRLDAQLFLRLMYASDCKYGDAFVIYELICFHKKNGIDAWMSISVQELIEKHSHVEINFGVIRYAISRLESCGIIESNPVVRNTKRQFRLNPVDLLEMVNSVSSSMPGLDSRFGITPL